MLQLQDKHPILVLLRRFNPAGVARFTDLCQRSTRIVD
jgi:hypothetical protein